ncbi:hypothetical protein I3842_09G187000 [Carya illinoinensis]|uniref:Uncharacterized protein n=1 Tax=Carya illinoinensis TaxID=32201 RepID=A0A922E8H7_CARIL|nr:hypothetical protein I3842_09G187000 [Carya illinoinensis]
MVFSPTSLTTRFTSRHFTSCTHFTSLLPLSTNRPPIFFSILGLSSWGLDKLPSIKAPCTQGVGKGLVDAIAAPKCFLQWVNPPISQEVRWQ